MLYDRVGELRGQVILTLAPEAFQAWMRIRESDAAQAFVLLLFPKAASTKEWIRESPAH